MIRLPVTSVLVPLVLLTVALTFSHSTTADADSDVAVSIELNKVEDLNTGCEGFLLIRNDSAITLDRFRLDMILFDQDEIISKRILLDMAPVRAEKSSVVSFELSDTQCSDVGRILVNDVTECRDAANGETLDCLAGLSVSSRAPIDFSL